MSQLVALPKVATPQGVDSAKHEIKHVYVQIQSSPDQFYKVFRNEAYLLPEKSPNYVKSITVVKGDWETVGSEKAVVYYPKGKHVSQQTEWFKDKLFRANDAVKSVTFKVLEGDMLEHYKSFVAQLEVNELDESNWARWTVAYEKKHSGTPDPDNYLKLLEKVSKDVDDNLPHHK